MIAPAYGVTLSPSWAENTGALTQGAHSYRDRLKDVRALARDKLLLDFRSSSLHTPAGILEHKKLTHRILQAAGIARSARLELLFRECHYATTSHYGLDHLSALGLIHREVAEKGQKLVVKIPSIAAGAMATLRSVQTRHSNLGFHEALQVDYSDVNGRDEMASLSRDGPVPDFMLAPDGAFSMSEGHVQNEYRMLTPFFVEDQYVLRRSDHRAAGGGRVWTYPCSSAETMILAWTRPKTVDGIEPQPWLAGMKIVPCDAAELPAVAASLAQSDMVAVWEPLVTRVLHEARVRHVTDPHSPTLLKVHGSEFPNVFSLSAHEKWSMPDRERLRHAIEEVLVGEWNRCRAEPEKAWGFLENDLQYLQYFAAGSGVSLPFSASASPSTEDQDPGDVTGVRFLGIPGLLPPGPIRQASQIWSPPGRPENKPEEAKARLVIHADRRITIDGYVVELGTVYFALICVLAAEFHAEADDAKQVDVARRLVAKLRSLAKSLSQ